MSCKHALHAHARPWCLHCIKLPMGTHRHTHVRTSALSAGLRATRVLGRMSMRDEKARVAAAAAGQGEEAGAQRQHHIEMGMGRHSDP